MQSLNRLIENIEFILDETKNLSRNFDCTNLKLILAYMAAPWTKQSNWITGVSLRESAGLSIDSATEKWNFEIETFENKLDSIVFFKSLCRITRYRNGNYVKSCFLLTLRVSNDF